MNTLNPKRLFSLLLAFTMLLLQMPFTQSVSAAQTSTQQSTTPQDTPPISEELTNEIATLDEAAVPEIIGIEHARAHNHVKRLYEYEGDDLTKIVFENEDGTKTMYLYDHPVKYVDEYGQMQDVSLEIADNADASKPFRSASNSAVTTFSAEMSNGITLTGNDATLRLVPERPDQEMAENAVQEHYARRVDEKTIEYPYDQYTTIEYSLTYTGFKEDIVVSQYTGQTEYTFTLYTNGLTLTQIDGSYYLTDEDRTIQATIGDIIIFTADERNNTFGQLQAVTVIPDEEYQLTIVLDPEYLADPDTCYPIRIDPTIELNYDKYGSGAIEDVTINSNAGSSGTSSSLFVGLRENYGISRILMRFPDLDLSDLSGAKVTSATVKLRDLLCESTSLNVYCYPYTGSDWTESSTWAALTKSQGALLSYNVISYSKGVNLEEKHEYSFNVTAAVQGWIDGNYDQDKGLVFKAADSLENGSTYNSRTFGSYNRSSYKPSLTVTYDSPDGDITAAGNYVAEGGTLQLSTDMTGTVTWTSSNTSVATVDSNGKVEGQHAGQVTITARASGYTDKTFTLWVTVPDGVYYINRNTLYLTVAEGCISNLTGVTQETISSDATVSLAQKWRIKYLGNGYYSIRPMHKLDLGLDKTDGRVDVYNISTTDSQSLPACVKWQIVYNINGYVFLNYDTADGSPSAMKPTGNSLSAGVEISAEAYDASVTYFRWSLTSTTVNTDAVIYCNGAIDNYARRGITPGQSSTLVDMGIIPAFICSTKITQTVDTWYSSNTHVASVDSTSGAVTAIANGTAVITARYSLDGIQHLASYTLVVSDIPISGYELEYEPELWNYSPVILNTNCYSYAINTHYIPGTTTLRSMQPGISQGLSITRSDISRDYIIDCIEKDATHYGFLFQPCEKTDICPSGAYKVALVIDPENDYHWYRQNTDGTWSHKRGNTNVINVDASGNIIYDPATANRNYSSILNYSEFIGYYFIVPINNLYTTSATNNLQTVNDLSITSYISFDAYKTTLPTITEAYSICVGMSYDQVTQLIGLPQEQVTFGLTVVRYNLDQSNSYLLIEYSLQNNQYVVVSYNLVEG